MLLMITLTCQGMAW